MASTEQLTLTLVCIGCIVHWVRHTSRGPAGALSATLASGGSGACSAGASSAAAAAPSERLLFGALTAGTALLLLLSLTRWWGKARPWAAAGVRLAAFVAMPPALTWAPLLTQPPGGSLADGIRVFLGAQLIRHGMACSCTCTATLVCPAPLLSSMHVEFNAWAAPVRAHLAPRSTQQTGAIASPLPQAPRHAACCCLAAAFRSARQPTCWCRQSAWRLRSLISRQPAPCR